MIKYGKFLCKQCGKLLEWLDTVDWEGGIAEGSIRERQIWTCEHCQKDYIIGAEADIKNVNVRYFEEA